MSFQGITSVPSRAARAREQVMNPKRRRKSIHPIALFEDLEDRTLLSNSIPLSATTWTAIGPAIISGTGGFGGTGGASGRIAGVAADPTDPKTLYIAAAGGGVWKTTNAGVSWTPLTDGQTDLFMGSIAVAPSNGQVIYAGEGEGNNSGDSYYGQGVLKSTDGGATWTLEGNSVFNRMTIPKIAISAQDPNIAYAAVSDFAANGLQGTTGIWKTTDGGTTWTNTTASISTSEQFSDIVVDPTNDRVAYAAVGTLFGSSANGVYKTSDGGTTWALAGNFPQNALVGRINLAIAASNPSEVVASVVDAGSGTLRALEKTTDGGTTWTAQANTPDFLAIGQGWYDNTVAISPTNPNQIIAAGVVDYGNNGINGIVMSLDGGNSWKDITSDSNGNQPHTDSHATTFDAAGHLLIGNDGGIWRLDNSTVPGFSWSNINGNLQITQFTGIALDPTNNNIVYGGSQDNGTEKFNDNLNWTQVFGGDGGFVAVDPSNPQTVYTENYSLSIARSDDGGNTFNYITNGINSGDNGNFYRPFIIDPSNSSHLLYGSDRIYTTTDQGNNWSAISAPNTAGWNSSAAINAIAIAPSDPKTIFASTTDGQIFISTDGGTNWTTSGLTVQGQFKQILIDPTDAKTAYVVRADFNSGNNVGHVFKTTDAGVTWTDISGDLPDVPTNAIALDTRGGSDRLYVGTDSGVYGSINGGTNWTTYETGFPHAQVVTLELSTNLNVLAAGTHGRGVFEIQTGQVLSITLSPLPTITEAVALPSTQLATFTDSAGVKPVGTYSATVDWGDGSATQNATIASLGNGVFSISGGHTYLTPGSYTLTINAAGTDGSVGQATETVTVQAAPLVTAPHSFTIVEGQTYTGSVGTFTTSNLSAPASRFSASIDWGDGNISTGTIVSKGNGVFEIDGTNQYAAFGTYTFTVTITDSLAGNTVFTGTATVTAAPIFSTGTSITTVEGTTVNTTIATLTSGALNPVASDFTATINWGDGSTSTSSTGVIIVDQGNHFDVKAPHAYARFGTYTITVKITSNGGSKTTAISTATVNDAPISASPISATLEQGVAFNGVIANILDGNILGVSSDLSATINWGDGTSTVAGTIKTVQANNFSVNGSHVYIIGGTYTVAVNVVDRGGQTTTTSSTIVVTNAPVTATGTTITGPAGVTFTKPVATFVDAFAGALLSDFSATIDWGDSSTVSTAVVSQPGGKGTPFVVTGTHGYVYPNTYTATITIDEGGVQVATTTTQAVQTDSPLTVVGTPLKPITIDKGFVGNLATFTTPNLLAPASFYLASIDWGDGTSGTGTVKETAAGSFTVSTNQPHSFPSIQNYVITVTVLALSGTQANATTTLQVNDAPIQATPSPYVQTFAGTTFTALLGTFTQYAAAPTSNFNVTVDWGDGTSTATVGQLANGTFTVTGSHAYELNGVYPIHVAIQSLGGSTGSFNLAAVVQDVPLNVVTDSIVTVQNQLFSNEIATFTTPNLLATAGEYTATVNWGDGTPTQGVAYAGGPNSSTNVAVVGSNGSFQVIASHTYANAPANYAVTVIVYHHSQPVIIPLSIRSQIPTIKALAVQEPPDTSSGSVGSARVLLPVSGGLSPASDSGVSNSDGITNINQPVFIGTANPGATIKLFANPPSSAPIQGGTFVGQATVNASGHWSIQVNTPLSDGQYFFNAQMIDTPTGNLIEDKSILATANNASLIISTAGPTVQSVVLDPSTGALRVTFHDAAGLNPNAVGNLSNYTFSKVTRYGTQAIAGSGVSLGGDPNNITATLAYSLRGGRGSTSYVIEINANGLTDLAGNTLVEKTFVTFPQITNSPNPDYVAEIAVNGGVAQGPTPYVSIPEQIAARQYSSLVQRNRFVRVAHPRMTTHFRRHR